jgi:hypothetical protein
MMESESAGERSVGISLLTLEQTRERAVTIDVIQLIEQSETGT